MRKVVCKRVSFCWVEVAAVMQGAGVSQRHQHRRSCWRSATTQSNFLSMDVAAFTLAFGAFPTRLALQALLLRMTMMTILCLQLRHFDWLLNYKSEIGVPAAVGS